MADEDVPELDDDFVRRADYNEGSYEERHGHALANRAEHQLRSGWSRVAPYLACAFALALVLWFGTRSISAFEEQQEGGDRQIGTIITDAPLPPP